MPQPKVYWQRLAGKVAIVTGAGSQGEGFGTGKAICAVFAREGAQVCLVDHVPARAEETLALIRSTGGAAFVCAADVTDSAACAAAVAATVQRYGALHVLINNVGLGAGGGHLEQLDEMLWQRIIDVNLKSTFLMCRHAIPQIVAAGGGAVVNIASTAGLRAHGAAAYGPAKAGVVTMTKELAVIYGRHGVRANTVAPGHIFTPLVSGALDDASRQNRRKVAPLGIEGDAWDVAAAALFLASDEARFITGTCLPVDGGVSEIAALSAYELIHQ